MAVKKLFGRDIIFRHQKNLDNDGCVYSYECNSWISIRKIIRGIIKNWFDVVGRKWIVSRCFLFYLDIRLFYLDI